MRAAAIGSDRALAEVSLPQPAPGPGQVRIAVAFCGICGSDVHFRSSPGLFPNGTVLGHEFCGRIDRVGPDVDAPWSVGDRVAVLPFAQCGACEPCRSGNEQACQAAAAGGIGLGSGRTGGYAEHVIVDASMLFALPDAVSDRAAALTEPLAVAIRAVNAAAVAPDTEIAVIGAGTIGVLVGLVLRARGCTRFSLVSRNRARGELAASLGLPVRSLGDFTAGLGGGSPAPQCVLECGGTPAAATLAVKAAAPLGRVILVGVSLEPLALPATAIVFKELSLRGAITYRRAEFQQAIDLLASGAVPTEQIVTATIGFGQVEELFGVLASRENPHLKVLIDPTLGAGGAVV